VNTNDTPVRRASDADALHREWLGLDGTGLWVDLVYRLLLGRPAEPDALLGAWRSLVLDPGSRRQLVREIVASREFAEAALIEQVVALSTAGEPWAHALVGHPDTTERVVEIGWVLSKYTGERMVLDVGTRHTCDTYATGLLRVADGATIVALDLLMVPIRGFVGLAGDGSKIPVASSAFDFVSCISTLEHIGHDNSRYGVSPSDGSPAAALVELARVLRPDGRLAVTVPYGRAELHGWFEQFDETSWRALVASAPLEVVEETVFRLEATGWAPCADRAELADVGYGDSGPAAGAVMCALFAPTSRANPRFWAPSRRDCAVTLPRTGR